jgi:hypothetical protein
VEHGALVEAVAAVAPVFESGVEVGKAHFSKEAEKSEVDAEDGRTDGSKNARGGKQGAVAAKNNHQARQMRGQLGASHSGRSVGIRCAIRSGKSRLSSSLFGLQTIATVVMRPSVMDPLDSDQFSTSTNPPCDENGNRSRITAQNNC